MIDYLKIYGGDIRWRCWRVDTAERAYYVHADQCLVAGHDGAIFALCGQPVPDDPIPERIRQMVVFTAQGTDRE